METSNAGNEGSEEVAPEICCEKKAKENVKRKQATELLATSGKQISDRGIDNHEQVAKIEFSGEHDIDYWTGI